MRSDFNVLIANCQPFWLEGYAFAHDSKIDITI